MTDTTEPADLAYARKARAEIERAAATMTPDEFRAHAFDVAELAAYLREELNELRAETLLLHKTLAITTENAISRQRSLRSAANLINLGRLQPALNAVIDLAKIEMPERYEFEADAYAQFAELRLDGSASATEPEKEPA